MLVNVREQAARRGSDSSARRSIVRRMAQYQPKDWAPLFESVRRVATAKGRAQEGAFVAEGRRLLERALRAGWVPREVIVAERAEEQDPMLAPLLAELAPLGRQARHAPEAALLELSEGRRSGLVTSLFDVPPNPPLLSLLQARPAPVVFLVLIDVEEPGNVGALIRTALACGAAGLICVGSTDPFHPKAVRTSLGSTFKLPLACAPAPLLFDTLHALRIHSLAAVAREGSPLHVASWPRGSVAVVVGNEARGLPEAWRDAADARVSIDLCRAVDSFSVNAAAAICLYEVQRRLMT
jgi:TrmH family RNA methyltransferase